MTRPRRKRCAVSNRPRRVAPEVGTSSLPPLAFGEQHSRVKLVAAQCFALFTWGIAFGDEGAYARCGDAEGRAGLGPRRRRRISVAGRREAPRRCTAAYRRSVRSMHLVLLRTVSRSSWVFNSHISLLSCTSLV